MAKTFILGVGAQRTGSTWLHAQLQKNRMIDMGLCKEYHVFDTLFTPYFPNYRNRLLEKVARAKETGEALEKELELLSFLEDPENYFDYFDKLHRRSHSTKAVGDMTPSYSMLDADAYRFIRNGLQERGFRIKVVFIMRDPVERIWSSFHQASKVRKCRERNQVRKADLSNFTNPAASMRTRYERTITELEQVFPKEDIFYDFYERFFTTESHSRLAAFLALKLRRPVSDRINPSLDKGDLDRGLAGVAAKHYAITYDFIRKRFGEQMLELWPGYQDLDFPSGAGKLSS